MSDLEKVIKGLEIHTKPNSRCVGCPYPNNGLCGDQLYMDALSLLKEHEWISVGERLPKDDEDILAYFVADEESRIVPVNYAKGVWFDCVFNTVIAIENITHWMPLPKPPTEGR